MHKNKHRSSLLNGYMEWHIETDLENHFIFLIEKALTTQHPDIIIWSVKLKKVFVNELMVPIEENFDWAHQPNLEKYEDMWLMSMKIRQWWLDNQCISY